ncbi:hypothetical protein MNV_80018 [Candidatus Methanoperedens nitroreducens]|uniref:Uncharacterized protein n=1 Tax=Candidatus Methanoperedens nitratireducens TaxID=1392998 RepID=A0A284VTX5_9EURY|nr:hypothetical protein MNV_80018 [Candidatus Methanoperedens nitroreducens]
MTFDKWLLTFMDCIDLQQQIEEKKYKIDINIIYKEIAINRNVRKHNSAKKK